MSDTFRYEDVGDHYIVTEILRRNAQGFPTSYQTVARENTGRVLFESVTDSESQAVADHDYAARKCILEQI